MQNWRLAAGGVGLALFVGLATAVVMGAPFVGAFDAWVQSWVFPLRADGATAILTALTHVSGTKASIVLAGGFTIYLWVRLGRRPALTYAGCVIAGEAVVAVAKFIVDRTRPLGLNLIEFPGDASFPSGHTFAAIAIVAFALYVVVRTHPGMPRGAKVALAVVAVAWPLLIAFTRIYLGAHWPTDIMGSLVLGGCAFFPFATYAWNRICGDADSSRPPQPVRGAHARGAHARRE